MTTSPVAARQGTPERPRVWRTFRDSPLPVKTLLCGVIVNRLSAFLMVFLVLFVQSRGYSSAQAVLAVGVYGGGAIAGSFIGGALADRGDKRAIVFSMASAGVLTASLPYLPTYELLLAAVALASLSAQVFKPASATMLSRLTREDRQVMIFAMFRFGLNVGATAAPLIGLWDSGIGGLTVMRALLESVPQETLVYFGDTARVPYGAKSRETITRFAIENTLFLLRHGIKCLVVACNTASAVALDALRDRFALPIVGMIDSGAQAAVQASASGRIGVIGTVGTVASGSYTRAITTLRPDAQVTSSACPLFVPFAEEGLVDHDAVRLLAREYLAPVMAARVDTVILGCTHYPLLAGAIGDVLGPDVRLVDSGRAAAREVTELLGWKDLRRPPGDGAPSHHVYVSDRGPQFQSVAERFLGRAVGDVSVVEQTDLPWYEKEIP